MGIKLQVEKPTILIVSLLFALFSLLLALTAIGVLPGELWKFSVTAGIFGIVGGIIIFSEIFLGRRKGSRPKVKWDTSNIISIVIASLSLISGIYLLIAGGMIEASRYLVGIIYVLLTAIVCVSLFNNEKR